MKSENTYKQLELFGGGFQRARKIHECWTCGRKIQVGETYYKTNGKYDGNMFSVKHCRQTCETTPELIDQNNDLGVHLHKKTLRNFECLAA